MKVLATAGLALGLYETWTAWRAGGTEAMVVALTSYSMANNKFYPNLAKGGIPILIGLGGSYVAAKTGVNRYTPKGINL